jgi:ABC-type transport system involved in cytochrome c biogenesis permease subunit
MKLFNIFSLVLAMTLAGPSGICAQEAAKPASTPASPPPAAAAPVPAATAKPAATPKPENKPAPAASLEVLRDPELVKIFAGLPAMVNGRIKPLDTVARFALLRFHGKQSIKAETLDESNGEKIPVIDPVTGEKLVDAKGKAQKFTAMEWMLLTWFRPESARALPVFIVDNSDAIVLLGLHGKGKRDRYSFNEIEGARQTLGERVKKIRAMKEEERSIEDRAIGKLALDFQDYEMMLSHFDFARDPFDGHAAEVPDAVLTASERQTADIGTILRKTQAYLDAEWKKFLDENVPDISQVQPALLAEGRESWGQQEALKAPWLTGLYRAMFGANLSGDRASLLRIFPPKDKGTLVWNGPGPIMQEVLFGTGKPTDEDFANLTRYGRLAQASLDAAQFKKEARAVVDHIDQAAAPRQEAQHIGLELHMHRADYFIRALYFFILGIIALAGTWTFMAMKEARPGLRHLAKLSLGLSWLSVLVGTVLGITGIVIRCIIMQRPPITNLYETIIFIATTGVIFGLVAEALTRRTFALLIANIAGMIGMYLSIRFLDMEARDTLQQLEAVLITNFWLATHVPCINLGYTAGMMACLFSMLYLGLRFLGKVKAGDVNARVIGGVSYAFVLVGLFLSLVGTVLGGVWANYSWGRFWGWDPKENGALMIVLMNLVILHGRLGNYIREPGFHAANVVLGMITLFSWFATNQLGIGLHAYGELSGAWVWLYRSWTLMACFVIYGMILSRIDRRARLQHKEATAPPLSGAQKV